MLDMSVANLGFLACALFFNTLTAPTVKFTQSADGSYTYNKYCIYFIAEFIKLIVAAGWSVWKYHTDPDIAKIMKVSRRDIMQ